MKDRLEIRITVASAEVEGKTINALFKILKPVGKVVETKLERIVEAFTKIVEFNTKEIVEEE